MSFINDVPPPPTLSAGYITETDLYRAYRKAKVDTYYERELSLSFEFVEYEEDLNANLASLFDRIVLQNWMEDPVILGSCVFIPKGLDFPDLPKNPQEKVDPANQIDPFGESIYTKASKHWRERHCQKGKPTAAFRPISRPSIDWLIISTLWIMKAGKKLDACLSDSVKGSRLRRMKNGSFNTEAMGCFAPYAHAYSDWRENGLGAIRRELTEQHDVIALTADLRKFYHSIDPIFLNSPKFRELIEERTIARHGEEMDVAEYAMDRDDWLFTELMVLSLRTWAELHKALFPGGKAVGLPIGPTASRLIANLTLLGFDLFIERNLHPIYYGRYVDDIFLVIPDGSHLETAADVWSRIEALGHVDPTGNCKIELMQESDTDKERVCRLHLDYAPGSDLRFAGKKQKVFFIEGVGGKALLESIEHQIRTSSSEWRHLPELPQFERDLHTDFLVANPDATESADNLRKADRVSIRRLRFALHLRDIEALAEDLELPQWRQPREKLFEFTLAYLAVLPEFFTYASYFPRIMALAVKAREWGKAKTLVKKIARTFKQIGEDCAISNEQHLNLCREDFGRKLRTATVRALPPFYWRKKDLPELFMEFIATLDSEFPHGYFIFDYQAFAIRLFNRDLGGIPFRARFLEGKETKEDIPPDLVLPPEVVDSFRILASYSFVNKVDPLLEYVPAGIIFPTRPFAPSEITLLCQNLLETEQSPSLREVVRAIRGVQFSELDDVRMQDWSSWFPPPKCPGQLLPAIWVPDANFKGSVRICLPCLKVGDDSWVASVTQQKDPDLFRYLRITQVLNNILSSRKLPDYVVMPELALKSRWFNRFAHKLAQSKISLIAGIEYEHLPFENNKKDQVVNSVRASLVTNFPGYWTYLIYSQNKERPAPQEETELLRLRSKRLVAGKSSKKIIRHGDFQFGILICSELTNIDFRAKLRGNIDALIVPQWNKDTEGFSPLVEATANDLHTFVIQSNNRTYGDSRIRAPYKDQWKRDVLRLKGGVDDYHATGEIDFMTLRRFQSSDRSPSGPFKPIPDGFEVHSSRRELPLSEGDGE